MTDRTDVPAGIVLADSATKLGGDASGSVIVTGSHGARYAAYLTLRAHPRAVIHNDAGIGLDDAGIAVLDMAQRLGVAAATASHATCRIGDAGDTMRRGTVSRVNALAAGLGVRERMGCREAAGLLLAATASGRDPEAITEARRVLREPGWEKAIALIDSASLVTPDDVGQIVVTASHGGLIGGNPRLAIQVDCLAAVYSDAGVGIEDAGISRLPALDSRGIAGVTVSAASARIGEAASIFEQGLISFANETARRLGAVPGEPLRPRIVRWAETF